MADTKTTGLDENTDPQPTDLLYMVDDPGGTPASEKVTVTNVLKAVNVLTALTAVDPADILYVIDDPSGTPTGKKATVDDILAAFDHGVLVRRTTTQSINNGAWTPIEFDTEVFDTDAYHDTVSNTDRLTIPSGHAGKYTVFANCVFATNATGFRGLRILHYNSSDVQQDILCGVTPEANQTQIHGLNVCAIVSLAEGDYVVAQAFQSSGGALNINADNQSGTSTRFGMHRIA